MAIFDLQILVDADDRKWLFSTKIEMFEYKVVEFKNPVEKI